MPLFKPKYTIVKVKKKEIPEGLWTKCEGCACAIYNKTLEENYRVCPKCAYHFSLTAKERIKLLIDEGAFLETDPDMVSSDPLGFKGPKTYADKLKSDQEATGLKDAVICGEGKIENKKR